MQYFFAVEINADVIDGSLNVIANGGNGHKGQDGGNGAKGGNRPQPVSQKPVGTQNYFIRGSSALRSKPSQLHIQVLQKRYPFYIPSIEKGILSTYLQQILRIIVSLTNDLFMGK